jgi:hypothetical protein
MWVRRDGGGWGDPVVNAVAVIGGAAVAAVASYELPCVNLFAVGRSVGRRVWGSITGSRLSGPAGWDRRLRVIGTLRRELPDRLLIVN